MPTLDVELTSMFSKSSQSSCTEWSEQGGRPVAGISQDPPEVQALWVGFPNEYVYGRSITLLYETYTSIKLKTQDSLCTGDKANLQTDHDAGQQPPLGSRFRAGSKGCWRSWRVGTCGGPSEDEVWAGKHDCRFTMCWHSSCKWLIIINSFIQISRNLMS